MQGTTGFHHSIAEVVFASTHFIHDDPTAFDASDRMFDADPQAGDSAITGFLFGRQFFAARLLERLQDGHIRQGEPLEASILTKLTFGRQAQATFIRDFLIVFLAFAGGAKPQDLSASINEQVVLDAVLFLLATVQVRLQNRVFGARNRPFSAILEEKTLVFGFG